MKIKQKLKVFLFLLFLFVILGKHHILVLSFNIYDQKEAEDLNFTFSMIDYEDYAITDEIAIRENQWMIEKAERLNKSDLLAFIKEKTWGTPITQKQAEEIAAKAKELTDGITDDYKKAEIIHDWIANNIYYNHYYTKNNTIVERPSDDAYTTYKTRIGVCAGYSQLNQLMLRAVGIPCVSVQGCGTYKTWSDYSKQDANSARYNHAWNLAYINGRWIFIDVTWDSGNSYTVSKEMARGISSRKYFDPSIEEYSKDHFSELLMEDYIIVIDGVNYLIDEEGGYAFLIDYDNQTPNVVIPEKIDGNIVWIKNEKAFQESFSLQSIELPGSFGTIPEKMFYRCRKLKKVILGEGTIYLAPQAFYGCSSMEAISLPQTLEYIDTQVFMNCSALQSIYIPDSVYYLGKQSFRYCKSLKSVILPKNGNLIPYGIFWGCSSLESISIPSNFTWIEKYAFYNCNSLENISMKKGLIAIEDRVFQGCRHLKELVFPSTTIKFGNQIVFNCSNLERITFESRDVIIAPFAFVKAYNLKEFIFKGKSQKYIKADLYIPKNSKVIVPAKYIKQYKKDFANCLNIRNKKVKIVEG